ncbi:hypothetical protein RchiOBHm_Chr7g0204431 [Rosa chinensis]|uniref:Uncharacterized protein n=1 Tax=Rosa chinensis TaxID=74649 RepID=A0A2P6P8N6_ROSCH|nr:hypothetical protein RchiOBHm_Chr7g0204431 [Rosa chinensis]
MPIRCLQKCLSEALEIGLVFTIETALFSSQSHIFEYVNRSTSDVMLYW